MTAESVRLVDGARELELHRAIWPRPDLILTNLDVPSPAIRSVVTDRVDDDGTEDSTTLYGARAVSVELRVLDRPAALVEEINAFLRPSARPYLYLADDEWPQERRLRLRVDQFSAPMPTTSHIFREVQLQWQAPDGVWEGAEPITAEVRAQVDDADGLTFPAEAPWTFPATSPPGISAHDNPGTEAAHQVVRLYGPCIGPRWTCDTTGESLIFHDSLVLGLGEFVEVDTRARTVLANGEPDASRLHHLDFAASSWWRIPPGESVLRFHPVRSAEAGSAALATYRPLWL